VFERVNQVIDNLTGETFHVDPARYNDPLALKTEWSIISKGGAGFGSHKLRSVGSDVLAFKLTWGAYLLSFSLILLWILGSILFWINETRVGPPYLILAVFGILGIVIFAMLAKPIVFDKGSGMFVKGKVSKEIMDGKESSKSARLEDVHAIQVLARLIRDYDSKTRTNRSYMTYEMNLVLHDAKRKNVIRHGNRGLMLDDAQTIANFLGVPVWDATV